MLPPRVTLKWPLLTHGSQLWTGQSSLFGTWFEADPFEDLVLLEVVTMQSLVPVHSGVVLVGDCRELNGGL